VLQSSDVGANVRVSVVATNSYGTETAVSAAAGPVLSGAPVDVTAPTVTGSAARGVALTASQGTWSPPGSSYTYQWQRSTNAGSSWSNIAAASSSTYTPALADEKAEIRVAVTAVNPYGNVTAVSAATAPVKTSPPNNTTTPTVSGTIKLGSKLTATSGSWAGIGNAYSYQWQRNAGYGFVNIKDATASTYTLTQADAGTVLRVVVAAANLDGSASQVSKTITSPTAASH